MLKIMKLKSRGILKIRLEGVIDENVNFFKLVPVSTQEILEFNCRQVQRMNSAGAREWVRFFTHLKRLGLKPRVTECSPTLVDWLNGLPAVADGVEVESVQLPFSCQECHKEWTSVLSSKRLCEEGFKLPELDCPDCETKLIFDHDENEYFGFLGAHERVAA